MTPAPSDFSSAWRKHKIWFCVWRGNLRALFSARPDVASAVSGLRVGLNRSDGFSIANSVSANCSRRLHGLSEWASGRMNGKVVFCGGENIWRVEALMQIAAGRLLTWGEKLSVRGAWNINSPAAKPHSFGIIHGEIERAGAIYSKWSWVWPQCEFAALKRH